MKNYIGIAMILASPMIKSTAWEKGLLKDKDEPMDSNQDFEEGYFIDYGHYQSWCPKAIFEAKYFPIEKSNKISNSDVEAFMVEGESIKLGDKTCVVKDTTITGFDTIGTSACVDPAEYNHEIGVEIARRDIKNTIWGHLGFVLQWAKNGLKPKTETRESVSNEG